jgi:glyoxylase-like metal-dependent hydrolase (beta-lactamase superfamily II)
LAHLGVAPARTDFILTHMHIDHIGLTQKIVEPGSRVFMGGKDVNLIDWWPGWEGIAARTRKQGYPIDELLETVGTDPFMRFKTPDTSAIIRLDGGEIFEAGGYRWEMVHTPGHTDGHMCLYERGEGIFIAGDHILGEISPNIQGWQSDQDRLADYMASLELVAAMDVKLLLPGHRAPLTDHRVRARELIDLHLQRLDEVRALLRANDLTGYETAARMKWELTFTDWDHWPLTQRWFATGEALSHLHWLVFSGEAKMVEREGLTKFSM